MNDVQVAQVVDRTEQAAQAERLKAVREIAKAVRELKVTGFDPVLALLDKAAKLDASLQERATLARDVVHTNAVPALIASGEITDEVLASFRQAAPSPDEIARLTAAVQHAVAAILRDAVAAAVAAGPATYAGLVKAADKAVADAAKVADEDDAARAHPLPPRRGGGARGRCGSSPTLTRSRPRTTGGQLAHAAYGLLRELGAVPAGPGRRRERLDALRAAVVGAARPAPPSLACAAPGVGDRQRRQAGHVRRRRRWWRTAKRGATRRPSCSPPTSRPATPLHGARPPSAGRLPPSTATQIDTTSESLDASASQGRRQEIERLADRPRRRRTGHLPRRHRRARPARPCPARHQQVGGLTP